ncbi:MAG: hypothetical protein IJA54_03960 [Tyzzerella sp.]|nr:hypothetical protein [Tyzzerella sp.]
MLMRQKDEEKRSKAWTIIMLVSSVLIILGIVFFITKVVVGNPLEGEWYSKANGYHLEVEDDNEVTLQGIFNGTHMEIDLKYTIDKSEKVISIKPNAESYADATEDSKGEITPGELDELLADFTVSYNYSLENDTLTLTEREYGEQYIFTRIEK